MSKNQEKFKTLLKNTEEKLTTFMTESNLVEFSKKLMVFYPTANNFFPQETQSYLQGKNFQKTFNLMQLEVSNFIKKHKAYEVQKEKIIIEDKAGVKKEHTLVDPVLFVAQAFNMSKTDEGFFLILSFFTQPLNYNTLQLFFIIMKSGKKS